MIARMESIDFGWREGMLLAALVAGAYLVVALVGLARLRRRPGPAAAVRTPTLPPEEPSMGVAEEVESAAVAIPPSAPFAAHLALTELEAEVGRLRAEVAALRQELADLKAPRRVSPLYAEAAALAQRGFDARGVAEECGISVAEAELVLAMSRDEKDFDSEVEDGSADASGRTAATERTGIAGHAG